MGGSAQCLGSVAGAFRLRFLKMNRRSKFAAGTALVMAMSAVSAAAVSAYGDPARGEAIYGRCGACHSLEFNRTGPRHCGLFGRRAGSLTDFAYSDAMRRSGIVWNEKTLDRFLADPLKIVPGTAMGYAGIKDSQERTDLIAYLKRASGSEACAESLPHSRNPPKPSVTVSSPEN